MLTYILGTILFFALSISADSNHNCYWRRLDQIVIKDQGWFQCNNTQQSSGGAQLCCKDGDQCGQDSICRTSDTEDSGSEWYVGGCTDGAYNDPVCRKDCSKSYVLAIEVVNELMDLAAGDKQTFITWNNSKNEWDCCGNYGCDGNTTSETFDAVSPSKWHAIPLTSSSSGLSTAAKAGIGAAAAIIIIALIGLGGWYMLRRRKQSRAGTFTKVAKGSYAKIGPQHEMGVGASRSGPSRSASPMLGSSQQRAVSPTPPNVAAQSAQIYSDQPAAQRQGSTE